MVVKSCLLSHVRKLKISADCPLLHRVIMLHHYDDNHILKQPSFDNQVGLWVQIHC